MSAQPENTVRLLLTTETAHIGRFVCPPSSPLWQEENTITMSCMVFPWTGVEITQAGRDPVVANPNHMIFHNTDHTYRRRPIADSGERSVFFGFEPEVWSELLADIDPEMSETPDTPFRYGDAPCISHDYLGHHRLVRALEHETAGTVGVEETLLAMARRALRAAYGVRGEGKKPSRPSTERAHRDSAHTAKIVLTERYTEPLTLHDVARAVHLSPYHLARVFRRYTGVSVHRYITRLRLRSALADLRAPIGITGLARRLGFASHAHFTDTFRREFGVTPSAFRAGAAIDDARLSQTGTILKN